jgi:hypothetical protein
MDFPLVAAVLRRVVAAEAAGEQIDDAAIQTLASELEAHPTEVEQACHFAAVKGLAWLGEEDLSASIRRAGEQYLALEGKVDRAVLSFLPTYVEDLNARRALICAGTVLLDEYQGALLKGRGIDFAQGLVPDAFEPVVTEGLALQFYAAAVALLVRLSGEEPTGCVAEEIVAVRLMQEAEAWLDMEVVHGSGGTPVAHSLHADAPPPHPGH